jgi:hypothetical protein
MRTALAATIILLFMWRAPAVADEVRILSSPGGQVGPFLDLFEGVRKMGDRVVIDGPCTSPITTTSPSSKAHQKSGPFAPPALPGLNAHMTPSDSRHGRRLRDVEAATLALDGASLELAAGP